MSPICFGLSRETSPQENLTPEASKHSGSSRRGFPVLNLQPREQTRIAASPSQSFLSSSCRAALSRKKRNGPHRAPYKSDLALQGPRHPNYSKGSSSVESLRAISGILHSSLGIRDAKSPAKVNRHYLPYSYYQCYW